MWIQGTGTYYSETGDAYKELENEDMGLFELKDSSYSTNSTRIGRGILPGILYTM